MIFIIIEKILENKLLRQLILILTFVLGIYFMVRAVIVPIDEYGTREINLVKTNGNTVCQSCMGLYK